ncbi:hypothetical protein [Bradyrhizobium genosp. P]|uniref:hypothetical protein n=1 Tax=Bradyrhizobium genosp. P TaxID=83641 RepID=UPI003CF4132F
MTAETVEGAVELAIAGTNEIVDFCDRLQPYWVLRVRGHSASWLVKTRSRTLKIGTAIPPAKASKVPELRKRGSALGDRFLGLRDAQKLVRAEWAKLDGRPQTDGTAQEIPGWTWGKLVAEYKKQLSEMREDASGKPIYPSTETQNDARLVFARPEVSKHDNKQLVDLNEDWFEGVQQKLHADHGFSAYRKFRAYAQAAFSWAASYRRKESGLTGRQWWLLAQKRLRTDDEVKERVARQKALRKKKENFKVEHLGQLLAEHERFCASRTGNARVSPSVRWGLWWDALTGHRRGSGTWVALEDVEFKDPRGEPGWGLATWQPEVMKTQDAFALPIPPLGLHIIDCCRRDWKKAASERKHNRIVNRSSKWVFASRVMSVGDVPASGSALANHLRSMRGLRQGNHRNVLHRIPAFSMHVIRSTLGDFILDHTPLPPGTASLMIGHEIAGDRRNELDQVGRTGKRWYFQAQRIPEKTAAMALWSDALLKAFLDAGGIYPD